MRPTFFKGGELPAGDLTSLLEALELDPQLVEGYQSLRGHVLEAAAHTIRLGDLLEPHSRLSLRVAPVSLALLLDELIERDSKPLGIPLRGYQVLGRDDSAGLPSATHGRH